MKPTYTKYSDPWEHLTFENRFTEDEIKVMVTEIIDGVRGKKVKSSGKWKFDNLEGLPTTQHIVAQHPLPKNLIDEFSYHRPYQKIVERSQVIVCMASPTMQEMHKGIHDEHESKILSLVTYLSPASQLGTYIFDRDKNFVKEMEWSSGRSFVFCAEDGVTWHSYGAKQGVRITLNTFLERVE